MYFTYQKKNTPKSSTAYTPIQAHRMLQSHWNINKKAYRVYSFIFVINQLEAQNFCFTISLFHASTCFEHHVLINRRSKLHYTASGIIAPIGGSPAHGWTVWSGQFEAEAASDRPTLLTGQQPSWTPLRVWRRCRKVFLHAINPMTVVQHVAWEI